MIYLSLASFLTGLAGVFEVASGIPAVGPLDSASFIASLSVSLLVAAVLWLVPIIQSSSDLSMADETIALLQDPPMTEQPPAPSALAGGWPLTRASHFQLVSQSDAIVGS